MGGWDQTVIAELRSGAIARAVEAGYGALVVSVDVCVRWKRERELHTGNEVLVDSGIRRGTDILTALALGARGVLVGRAYLYGLAAAGEPGVRHVIDILAAELRTAMALSGARRIPDLDRDLIRRRVSAPPRP